MASITTEPTQAEIDALRSSVLSRIEEEDAVSLLYPKDLNRFRCDDRWLRRFLMHHNNDPKLSANMAFETMKWRKEIGVYNINETTVRKEFFDHNSLYLKNRDKDGFIMLIFCVKNHTKGVYDMADLERFFVYWLERFEREEEDHFVTVVFDMSEAGMKNMDMAFIKYMIDLFKNYYPWILNYILVFEMPFLLNALWKIIKGWLPPKSIQKIKFIDKKSILTYVSEDQCLAHWGGTDSSNYKFEPEKRPSTALVNGDLDAKKVHFAELHSVGNSPAMRKMQNLVASSPSGAVKLDIQPKEELMFTHYHVGATASIVLTNQSEQSIAYKIKTTSPESYRVRPSVGVLSMGAEIEVLVTLNEQLPPSMLVKDKFLIVAMGNVVDAALHSDYSQLFKKAPKNDLLEVRLRVSVSASSDQSVSSQGQLNAPIGLHTSENAVNTTQNIVTKVDQVLVRLVSLEEQLRSARRMLFLSLVMMVGLLVLLVFSTNSLTATLVAQSNAMLANSQQQQQQQPDITAPQGIKAEL